MSVIEILAFFRLFFHPANKEAKADGCHVNPMSTEANFSAPVLVMRVRTFNWQAGGSAGIFFFASDSSEAEQNWQFDLNGTRAVRSVLASSNQRVGRMACITFFFLPPPCGCVAN